LYHDSSHIPIEIISAHSFTLIFIYILEGAVTQLKISPDGKFIISGGSDGCLFVISVKEYDQDN
jgi:WD40 repeat protein